MVLIVHHQNIICPRQVVGGDLGGDVPGRDRSRVLRRSAPSLGERACRRSSRGCRGSGLQGRSWDRPLPGLEARPQRSVTDRCSQRRQRERVGSGRESAAGCWVRPTSQAPDGDGVHRRRGTGPPLQGGMLLGELQPLAKSTGCRSVWSGTAPSGWSSSVSRSAGSTCNSAATPSSGRPPRATTSSYLSSGVGHDQARRPICQTNQA
jgi:hypothetical protein